MLRKPGLGPRRVTSAGPGGRSSVGFRTRRYGVGDGAAATSAVIQMASLEGRAASTAAVDAVTIARQRLVSSAARPSSSQVSASVASPQRGRSRNGLLAASALANRDDSQVMLEHGTSSDQSGEDDPFSFLSDASVQGPPREVRQTHERHVRLAGVAMGLAGELAKPTPGYGRGVPPTARVELCVVVQRRGAPPVYVTGSSDGTNLFWAPSSDWEQLGQVPFVSVFSRLLGGRLGGRQIAAIQARAAQRLSKLEDADADGTSGDGRGSTCGSRRGGGGGNVVGSPGGLESGSNAGNSPISPIATSGRHTGGRRGVAAGYSGSTGSGGGANVRSARAAKARANQQQRADEAAVRRERAVQETQNMHLDPTRESFIKNEMLTTVLHPVDFDVTRRVYAELERSRLLVERYAANGKKDGGGGACGAVVGTARSARPTTAREAVGVVEARGQDSSQQALVIPSTPRGVLEMVKAKVRASSVAGSHRETDIASPGSGKAVGVKACGGGGIVGGAGLRGPAQPGSDPIPSSPGGGAVSSGGDIDGNRSSKHCRPEHLFWRQPAQQNASVRLSCAATHPKRPCLVVAIGNGEVAVYHLFRAHGERCVKLHQTQGFDASRGGRAVASCGSGRGAPRTNLVGGAVAESQDPHDADVATALHVPAEPLAQEGGLQHMSFVAGFRSGRVAVFQILWPPAERRGAHQRRGAAAMDSMWPHEEGIACASARTTNQVSPCSANVVGASAASGVNACGGAAGGDWQGQVWSQAEPALSATEPLLLEHWHSKCSVVNVFWHPSLGLLSASTDGSVVVADTTGAATWTVQEMVGPGAMLFSADLSFEREELAVAGNRVVSLWQCISQTQVGVLDTAEVLKSPVLLVRYLPSQLFVVTVHESDGAVLIWDVAVLGLHRTVWLPPSWPMPPAASCAVWVPQRRVRGDDGGSKSSSHCLSGGSLLIFGPEGLTERKLCEFEVDVPPAALLASRASTPVEEDAPGCSA